MSDIPEDILEAAMEALKAARPAYDSQDQYDAHWESVARAILVERERCAELARSRFTLETVVKNTKGRPYATGQAAIYAARAIAAAIRNPSSHTEG